MGSLGVGGGGILCAVLSNPCYWYVCWKWPDGNVATMEAVNSLLSTWGYISKLRQN